MTELLNEPYAVVVMGIVFLFGGLGVFKLLRRSSTSSDQSESSETDQSED